VKRFRTAAATASRLLRETFLLPLHAYRAVISPNLAPRCRYYPSCSTYAVQAVRELGVIRGTVLAVWRVVRCNPWSPGGVDELADRRLFRDHRHPHDDAGTRTGTGAHA
jgi:putative membrane protein insertion efficiency factor